MESFREWLAIRVGGNDDNTWPAMVFFDPSTGFKIETVTFGTPEEPRDFESPLITGYLDYQKPVTFISNFVHQRAGMTFASGLATRSRFGIISNQMLRGIHLPSVDATVFRGFVCELTGFHRWYNRSGVATGFEVVDDMPAPSIELSPPLREVFSLTYGTLEVANYNSLGSVHGDHPLRNRTRLKLELSHPRTFSDMLKLASAVQLTFNFLVGARFPLPDYTFLTTLTGIEPGSNLNADLYFASSHKTKTVDANHQTLFSRGETTVDAYALLETCADTDQQHMRYKMGLVLAFEMDELDVSDGYGEILGALEDMDIRINGRGNKSTRLKQRLARLINIWTADGFRGSPDLDAIVRHRNFKPHGRGHELSSEEFQYMYTILPFLSGLLRYHVCKKLGFSADEISTAFTHSYCRYGAFARRSSPVQPSD